MTEETASQRRWRTHAGWLVVILAATAVAYIPGLQAELVNWDDPAFVTQNPLIRELTWDNISAMFTQEYWAAYLPLTLLSYAVEFQLVGTEPWLYHATNLVLHLATTALVYVWLLGLCGRSRVAGVAALLFGLHTLHVESVVWVSERKDVLYGFFFVAALVVWNRYLARASRSSYLLTLGLFLCSLLSKAVAASLSVTLVVIDLLLGRSLKERRVVLEKLPFFALSLLFGAIAVVAQQVPGGISHSIGSREFTLVERSALACSSLTQYLAKLALPINLSAFYPYPEKVGGAMPPHYWLHALTAIALAAAVVLTIRRRPAVAFGILFFVVNVALVLQVLPYGNFVMADRYTYIPSIGVFLLVALAADRLAARGGRWRLAVTTAVVVYAAVLGALTFARCQVWHDSMTLWNDVLAKYPNVWEAWDNRGSARAARGDFEGAVEDHTRAIELVPNFDGGYYNRGNARFRLGDLEGAIADYAAALLLRPDNRQAYTNRELARQMLQTRHTEPQSPVDPEHLDEEIASAIASYDSGDHAGALARLNRVVDSGAAGAPAFLYRGLTRIHLGDLAGALADLDTAIRLQPDLAEAWAYRGATRIMARDLEGAVADCDRALALRPSLVDALVTRGAALHNLGRMQAAIADFDRALALDPDNAQATFNRGKARVLSGDTGAGCLDLETARRLGHPAAAAALTTHCGG